MAEIEGDSLGDLAGTVKPVEAVKPVVADSVPQRHYSSTNWDGVLNVTRKAGGLVVLVGLASSFVASCFLRDQPYNPNNVIGNVAMYAAFASAMIGGVAQIAYSARNAPAAAPQQAPELKALRKS